MSVPNSILSVLLVVVWLFVLVPMFVNRRPKVMTVSQTALNTRVLFQGGLDKLKHRIRPGSPEADSFEEEDEEEEDEGGSTARLPVAEVFAEEHDEEYEVADEAEFVEDDVPPRRPRREEVVDDAEVVDPEQEDERPRRRPAPSASGEFDDEELPGSADLDEEELEHLVHRLGRGGYNPSADASARAQRYAARQRFVLGLLIALIAATVLAFAMSPVVWYAVAAIAAALASYLAYLRRQVRIEERIRARRMARFARTRRSEHPDSDIRPEAPPRAERREPEQGRGTPRPAAKKTRGPQVVAIDEDDPDFAFLPSPREGELRRAAGQ